MSRLIFCQVINFGIPSFLALLPKVIMLIVTKVNREKNDSDNHPYWPDMSRVIFCQIINFGTPSILVLLPRFIMFMDTAFSVYQNSIYPAIHISGSY